MPLASSSYSYPLLGAFWTIFEIFLWVIWFWILITVFIDIFRSADLSGWGKALWFLFVLLIPLIGVLVYLIVKKAGHVWGLDGWAEKLAFFKEHPKLRPLVA